MVKFNENSGATVPVPTKIMVYANVYTVSTTTGYEQKTLQEKIIFCWQLLNDCLMRWISEVDKN
jgi:hypothetical protein